MNLKLARGLNPRATHENTLVMRRSLDGGEDQGAEVPAAVGDPGGVPAACPVRWSTDDYHGHSRTAP